MTTTGTGLDDQQLMLQVQTDDRDAFGELYDRHGPRAYRLARSVCGDERQAENAVREGFLAIWRGRRHYRPEQGSFQAWVMTTVHRRATEGLRTHATADEEASRGSGGELAGALSRMPDEQAEVIALAFFGGLTHHEIADELGLTPESVTGRMRLGLEQVRAQVDRP